VTPFVQPKMWCILAVAWASISLRRTAPEKLAPEVKREANENLQIHDVFGGLENEDQQVVQRMKADHNLAAVQTAPDMASEVRKEANQNLQIHDVFGTLEHRDREEEQKVKANRSLRAFLQTAPEMDSEVRKEANQNLQIHDVFGTLEQNDKKVEKTIKSDRNLTALQIHNDNDNDTDAMSQYLGEIAFQKKSRGNDEPTKDSGENLDGRVVNIPLNSQLQETLLQQSSKTDLRAKKTAPGVEQKVAVEKLEDVYIQDGFKSLESNDVHDVNVVKADPNLKQ